jgi:large subunit ribosomal protein L31
MKTDIHPAYEPATITCACGEIIHTRSTKKNVRVEICSKCHPFFTGAKKYVEGRGLRLEIRKRSDAENIKKLVAIKINN